MHTVAIVEDDRIEIELFNVWLCKCRGLKVVGIFTTAEKALRELATTRPDVVLMDIKLPGMDGIQCVRALRSQRPLLGSRVLILTDYEEEGLIFEAFRAGADGYLLKRDLTRKQLGTAVRDVLRGGAPMSPSVAKTVIEYFKAASSDPKIAEAREDPTQLSVREQEVLQLLLTGFPYKEIASRLSVSIHGVRKHVQSIYQKLHVHSRSDPRLLALVPKIRTSS